MSDHPQPFSVDTLTLVLSTYAKLCETRGIEPFVTLYDFLYPQPKQELHTTPETSEPERLRTAADRFIKDVCAKRGHPLTFCLCGEVVSGNQPPAESN